MRETIECLIGSRTHHLLILPGKLFSIRVSWLKKKSYSCHIGSCTNELQLKKSIVKTKRELKRRKNWDGLQIFLAKLASRPNLQFTFSLLTYLYMITWWLSLKVLFFRPQTYTEECSKVQNWLTKETHSNHMLRKISTNHHIVLLLQLHTPSPSSLIMRIFGSWNLCFNF